MKHNSGSSSGTIAALATETVDVPVNAAGRATILIKNTPTLTADIVVEY